MFDFNAIPRKAYQKQFISPSDKWKFRSRLIALQNRKLDNGLVTTLCTYMPRGKKYPYASVKRGVK